jgi:hypothetical protein
MRFSTDFESGSIHSATPLDTQGRAWDLKLRDDNNDASLPNSYRTWWHVRADAVPMGRSVRLEFSRLGFAYDFVPVYSYDGRSWQYFSEAEAQLAPGCDVALPDSCRMVVNKAFTAGTVWIARTFPYTTADLAAFLATLAGNPHVASRSIASTPGHGKAITLLTITDAAATGPRQTVWVHARTHPAETGPSFVLEGLIGTLLADDATGRALRQRYVFKIVPMHNPDGVVAGNYRTNTRSQNLETLWRPAASGPHLDASAPLENQALNIEGMVPALQDALSPVVLALNLHSSNSTPDTAAFLFPHFGSDATRYSAAQRNLWSKQIAFINALAGHYDGRIEMPPPEGGAGFLATPYPETWWWTQAQDGVNAITLETTYGRAGFDHWVTQADLRALGSALARTIHGMDSTAAEPARATAARPLFRLPFKPEIYDEAQH